MDIKSKLVKHKRVIKYAIIGIITQIIDFSTYLILVSLGINYIVADLINNPLVLGFNYFAHKYFTFESKKWSNKELIKYIINLVINYIYSSVVLIIATNLSGYNLILGKLLQIIFITASNYLMLKKFVFKP